MQLIFNVTIFSAKLFASTRTQTCCKHENTELKTGAVLKVHTKCLSNVLFNCHLKNKIEMNHSSPIIVNRESNLIYHQAHLCRCFEVSRARSSPSLLNALSLSLPFSACLHPQTGPQSRLRPAAISPLSPPRLPIVPCPLPTTLTLRYLPSSSGPPIGAASQPAAPTVQIPPGDLDRQPPPVRVCALSTCRPI